MKSNKQDHTTGIRRLVNSLSRWCAYRYLYQVASALIRGGQLSEQVKAGRNIALLGFFCPFFWFALFSGANASTIALHAAHSGIVFLIGIGILVIGLIKQNQ
jgi:hypothetical protein